MCGTKASRRRVKRSLNCKETPPVRAGFFITVPSMYLVYTIIGQLKFRAHSIIGVLVLSLSLLFIIVGLATVFLSNRLDFPEVESDIGETKN